MHQRLALLLTALLSCFLSSQCELVYVNPQTCNETSPLPTLDSILNGNVSSHTKYSLRPGTHCVKNFSYVQDLSNVTFSGNSSDLGLVRVTCMEGVGLAFINISGLSFEGMTVASCGLPGDERLDVFEARLRNYTDFFFNIYRSDVFAMVVGLTSNFKLSHFALNDTDGLGLLAVNLQSAVIEHANFSYNHPLHCFELPSGNSTLNFTASNQVGGGAMFLYHTYWAGPVEDLALLSIQNSTFQNNSYCGLAAVIEVYYSYSSIAQDIGYALGAGGGLSVMLAQQNFYVNVTVDSSQFRNNTSRYGGGAHIAMFGGVYNNNMTFTNCTFFKNGLEGYIVTELSYATTAAALYFIKDLSHPTTQSFTQVEQFAPNTLFLQNCNITANRASSAGALLIQSLYSTSTPVSSTSHDMVIFDSCTISENEALLGAAIYMVEAKQSGAQPGLSVVLRNVVFKKNRILYETPGSVLTLSKTASSAAIEAQAINITIEGESLISENYATALRAVSSLLYLGDRVVFCNNSGSFGGAMHLVSSTYLILKNNSYARFENNTGAVQGGAFYINLLANLPDLYYQDCFLYFNEIDILCYAPAICPNVEELDIKLDLIDNKSPIGSLMFGSTLDTCPWSFDLKKDYGDRPVLDIMYYNLSYMFNFSTPPDTITAVTTPTTKLVISNSDPSSPFNVIPGELFQLNVTGYDRLNQSTPVVLSSKPSDDSLNISSSLGYSDFTFVPGSTSVLSPMIVTGVENTTNVSIFLYSTDSFTQAQFQVNLLNCTAGFYYDGYQCQCDSRLSKFRIKCNSSSMTLTVPNSAWVGPGPNGQLMVYDCISDYCGLGEHKVKPPDFDVQCHPSFSRTGILCGGCEEGYGTVLGSHRCLKCNNSGIALILFFAIAGILIVFAISFLRITVTDGYLNTILFYCNIVSVYIPLLNSNERISAMFFMISWFNLDFGIEHCLYEGMTSLAHVSLQFVFPAYLYFIMLVIMIVAKRSGKLSRIISNAQFSPSKLFATLLLMSYTSLLETCLEVLGVVKVTTLDGTGYTLWRTDPNQQYFRGAHIPLGIVSIAMLLFFIFPAPFLLMFPSVTFSTRLGLKMKPIFDAFWAPFRTRLRFYVGVRLLLRVIPYAFVYLLPHPVNIMLLGLFSLSVLFFQVLIWPFEGFMRNAFDFFFLSNIIVLCIGALYFEIFIAAFQKDGQFVPYHHDQQIYFACMVTVAYIAIALIMGWHIVRRFPALQRLFRMILLKIRRKESVGDPGDSSPILPHTSQNHSSNDVNHSSSSEGTYGATINSKMRHVEEEEEEEELRDRTDTKKMNAQSHMPVTVNYSILREPLLEEGLGDMIPVTN